MERLFFGYGSKPDLLRETLNAAANKARELPMVSSSISWEDMVVDGRLIINEIEAKIRDASLCIFDLTSMNENVLFELGFAIGQQKRVSIILDSDDKEARVLWSRFSLLSTTGWTGYTDLDSLVAQIARLVSVDGEPLWNDLMHGVDAVLDESRLLYFPSAKRDQASRRLSRLVERHKKFTVETMDLVDYGTMPLEWHAEQLYSARTLIFHLTPSRGYLAEVANPRMSFLAGIARGLDRDVVFAIEDGQQTAIDYRDLSIQYSTVSSLEKRMNVWLENLRDVKLNTRRPRRDLSSELATLRFGDHVAERDADGLEHYFVETAEFWEVVNASATIFTGKKGTGKTANMLRAAAVLQEDARNLVCKIKPASYELEALLEVLRKIDSRHLDDYLIEALWKYLIYTQIATSAVEEAESRPAGIAIGSDLDALRSCLKRRHMGVDASFSVRLEMLVDSLNDLVNRGVEPAAISESRQKIGEALYGRSLKELRSLIGKALAHKDRVAVLVDNLDKAWERGADLDLLSRLLLGLLSTVGRIVDEFRKENPNKARVNVTLTVFLRSDIFAYVRGRAREPDKIKITEIEWRNDQLLARVIEDRFVAGRPSGTSRDELWSGYFCPTVGGISTRDYILSRVQRRPRDVVYLANFAVSHASNFRHHLVEESDILEAEKVYSRFAYDALIVEGLALVHDLDTVLIEFAGESPIVTMADLKRILESAGRIDESGDLVVKALRQLGFLGLEVSGGNFDYGGTENEIRRADVLARKYEKTSGGESRFEVHSAYRAYLEMRE